MHFNWIFSLIYDVGVRCWPRMVLSKLRDSIYSALSIIQVNLGNRMSIENLAREKMAGFVGIRNIDDISAIKCVLKSLFPMTAILFFVCCRQIKNLPEGGLDSFRASHAHNAMYSVCRLQWVKSMSEFIFQNVSEIYDSYQRNSFLKLSI